MFDEGSWWQPPPHNILTGGMPECLYHTAFDGGLPAERPIAKSRKRKYSSSEDEEEDRKEIKTKWRGVLSTAERDELEDILRGLLPEKSSVADAMVWCVEHATCAKEISQCLHESLTIDETPLHKKVHFISHLLFVKRNQFQIIYIKDSHSFCLSFFRFIQCLNFNNILN